MLGDMKVSASIAVKNLEESKAFYKDLLGLHLVAEIPGVNVYEGNGSIVIYQAPSAGTGEATVAMWDVSGHFDEVVAALKEKGVQFEDYTPPQEVQDSVAAVAPNMQAAWFKDPSGNVLGLNARG
jgi:catechol 2,3-dioxygenase-like lactoylglutathione lyase family enzyme